MRRITENKPQSIDWNKEIDVKITVGELALFSALLGKSNAHDKETKVDDIVGVGTYREITNNSDKIDYGRQTYEETLEILHEEGAIE